MVSLGLSRQRSPMTKSQTIAIVGPTASGKSSLAERVASELNTSIVSIDAMQVYRGMDIGTAKSYPRNDTVKLYMVDVADLNEDYSVALFQADARTCIDRMLAEGVPAVLCGGTGLYLDAVIDEMDFPSGDVKGASRRAYEEIANREGVEALHRLLEQRDPQAASLIHPHNVRRVVRALEMADEGVSYAVQNQRLKVRKPHYQTSLWALDMDRAVLYRRIDMRVDQMFDDGLVQEVEGLMSRGLRESTTARQAIGYKEVIEALEGRFTLDEARTLIKTRTRRYAKRQLSWIRRDGRARILDMGMLGEDGALELILSSEREGC